MKSKLKIIIPVIVIIAVAIVGIILFANKREQVDTLELTAEMIEELEERIEKWNYEIGIALYIAATTTSTDDYSITDFEMTNHKKTDKYTYTVYGKLYYKDNYNNSMYDKIELKYKAVKDESEEKGYRLTFTWH